MNAPRNLLILAALLASSAALVRAEEKSADTAKPAAAPAAASRYQQVQDKIAALLEHRKETPPPPDPTHNPFLPPGSAPVVAPAMIDGDATAVEDDSVTSDSRPGASLTLLQQGVATLKVGGTIALGGRTHLVINTRPYKEGDIVQTQVLGKTVYLRVKEIAKRSVTLALNDAEMTLKY